MNVIYHYWRKSFDLEIGSEARIVFPKDISERIKRETEQKIGRLWKVLLYEEDEPRMAKRLREVDY